MIKNIKQIVILLTVLVFSFTLIFAKSNEDTSKQKIELKLGSSIMNVTATDTTIVTGVDTIAGYLQLAYQWQGSYGHYRGGANLDFVANGVDCDTTANIYLGDGSPFISFINGADTILYTSFLNYIEEPNAFVYLNDVNNIATFGSGTNYNWYQSPVFITPDSSIALQQDFYAPTDVGASFMIKKLKVWSHDGATHSGIRIGDVIDWDIPSDSGNDNQAGIYPLPTRNLIYQYGVEYGTVDTVGNSDCVDSDRRYGGMAFVRTDTNGIEAYNTPYSAYTARNDTFIYQHGGKLLSGELWNNTDNPGFTAEPASVDQHMVMCYHPSLTLNATDTVEFWISLVTVYDGAFSDVATVADNAKEFIQLYIPYPDSSCCVGFIENVDLDPGGIVDISDLVYFVAFMFTGGPVPPCSESGDFNGDGIIDISDLIHLVDCMFFGTAPCFVPCP